MMRDLYSRLAERPTTPADTLCRQDANGDEMLSIGTTLTASVETVDNDRSADLLLRSTGP
jgi:hypothetical protein